MPKDSSRSIHHCPDDVAGRIVLCRGAMFQPRRRETPTHDIQLCHTHCFQVSHAIHFRLPDLWCALLCIISGMWRVLLTLRGQQQGTIRDTETRVKQPGSPHLPSKRALLGSLDLALALLAEAR